jgi:hypothetical protein
MKKDVKVAGEPAPLHAGTYESYLLPSVLTDG